MDDQIKLEIDPATLRTWLEEGQAVKVIDIRPPADFEEWHIPGSENVYAYHALYARQPGPLADYHPPKGEPVVAVCYSGNTSKVAANYLRSRGINALSLMGGMQWWSLAWNRAKVPLEKSSAQVIQIRRTGKGCLSYMIASQGEALVIDPSVNAEIYQSLANENNWKITKVVDTHVHADHLSRGRSLAELTEAIFYLPQQDRVSFPYEPLHPEDTLAIGEANLSVLATPGHTFESICLLLDEEALFTGDTLFPTSIGRPDLKADRKGTEKRTHALYNSLEALVKLPEDTLILAGHTGEPIAFDESPIMASIGKALEDIAIIKSSEKDFVATVLKNIPATPPNHLQIVKYNEAGVLPAGDVSVLEAGANRCAL
ncbi:MAG: MBL fold metallo-hydrolase [Anaerolineae bacterium]|nr:MBL fold metallo-hydrolase [Anaerolineae bacterium]